MKMKHTIAIIIFINSSYHLSGQILYRNYDPPFIMQLPANWIKEKPIVQGVELYVRDENSGCSITVITESTKNLTIKDAHELPIEYFRKDPDGPSEEKIISFDKIYLNNQKTVRVVTEYRFRNVDMDTIMSSTIYAIIKDANLYRIAIGGEKVIFRAMKDSLEQIVYTFYINAPLESKPNTLENNIFRSELNNFSINFETAPNIDSKEDITTYLVTSLKDSAIYRINVRSNFVLYTSHDIQRKIVDDYMDALCNELREKNIVYRKIEFNDLQAIEFNGEVLTYGDVPILGYKARWKSLIFVNEDKVYTIQVTSTLNRIEFNYQSFINNFKFLY